MIIIGIGTLLWKLQQQLNIVHNNIVSNRHLSSSSLPISKEVGLSTTSFSGASDGELKSDNNNNDEEDILVVNPTDRFVNRTEEAQEKVNEYDSNETINGSIPSNPIIIPATIPNNTILQE